MTDYWPCPVYRLQGPPGTGKTYALTKAWIPRAVELYGEECVHVCSLTRSAAAEIGGRANLPRESVTTLHALAYRAAGKPALAQDSKNIKLWNDQVPVEWRITGKSTKDELEFDATSSVELGDKLLEEATILRNKMIDTKEWSGPVLTFYQAWRKWKIDMQYLDFTDLISLPVEFGSLPPGCIKALVCDEAQDFTFLDIALIKHWAQWLEMVVLAGDANQALYSFIGANPRAFMPADIPDEEITTLKQSYRVPRSVVEYADKWIEQDTAHRRFPYKPRMEDGETVDGVVARKPGFTLEHPRGLIQDALAQAKSGNTVMILSTCKYQLDRVTGLLRRSGIPFWNPYRSKERAWNPLLGGVRRLIQFLRPWKNEIKGREEGAWTWCEFASWVAPIRLRGTFRNGAGGEIDFRKKKVEKVTKDELVGLLMQGQYDLLLDALLDEDPLAAVKWYESRLNKAGQQLMSMACSIVKAGGVSALQDRPKIIVGTMHSVKGGEADVVYLSPDLGRSAMREWDNLNDTTGRDAIVRTFYVGMTRARKAVALMGETSRNSVNWL